MVIDGSQKLFIRVTCHGDIFVDQPYTQQDINEATYIVARQDDEKLRVVKDRYSTFVDVPISGDEALRVARLRAEKRRTLFFGAL